MTDLGYITGVAIKKDLITPDRLFPLLHEDKLNKWRFPQSPVRLKYSWNDMKNLKATIDKREYCVWLLCSGSAVG